MKLNVACLALSITGQATSCLVMLKAPQNKTLGKIQLECFFPEVTTRLFGTFSIAR